MIQFQFPIETLNKQRIWKKLFLFHMFALDAIKRTFYALLFFHYNLIKRKTSIIFCDKTLTICNVYIQLKRGFVLWDSWLEFFTVKNYCVVHRHFRNNLKLYVWILLARCEVKVKDEKIKSLDWNIIQKKEKLCRKKSLFRLILHKIGW